MNLYESVLCDEWATLDPSVREFLAASDTRYTGTLTINNGNWLPARLAARMLRLPRAGNNLHVTLLRSRQGDREIWDRRFPDVRLRSEQWVEDGLIAEQMGIVICRFKIRAVGGALMFQHDSTLFTLLGIRIHLPKAIAPTIQAYVEPSPDPGATFVHVALSLPLVRIVLAYSGTVKQA